MQIITVSGPPSSGKTSVIIHMIAGLREQDYIVGVIKFDCLSTDDDKIYNRENIPVKIGLSGNLCPDHFFASNFEDCIQWGEKNNFNILILESAGLCNRCSPHIRDIKAVCVIDNLMGINTPRKIGPMLKMADIVAITKGDVVSQAEREVFSFRVRQVNPKAIIMQINGITGQGCLELSKMILCNAEVDISQLKLRFTMPAAVCSYCLGETRIGAEYHIGNSKRMELE
ncbi:GTP-binding protein [[Clostridium] fimetarium]|uniref:Ni2+-binding GTPase involved in regulation of expression and maturation of urease and hydrogenase n=1 Tax=[Clostridium] fimetarium TaxID=99656 RepID=A0A1I0RX82_9FIRM|nr:GTP-binding protein [[Clostridium] fimetarium]SEW46164.1 Ni2+-binding GTPase involved in regulation of expression and maturation of urease and hydrogenase [[Clostridium] fimetarium]